MKSVQSRACLPAVNAIVGEVWLPAVFAIALPGMA